MRIFYEPPSPLFVHVFFDWPQTNLGQIYLGSDPKEDNQEGIDKNA